MHLNQKVHFSFEKEREREKKKLSEIYENTTEKNSSFVINKTIKG